MRLLTNEQVIGGFAGDRLTLTSHRLIYKTQSWGKARLSSIMLEELSFIEVGYQSNIRLPVAATITLGLGFLLQRYANFLGLNGALALAFCGLVAIALFVAFLCTRKQVLLIASSGGKIPVDLTGVGFSESEEFFHYVYACKDARFNGKSNEPPHRQQPPIPTPLQKVG